MTFEHAHHVSDRVDRQDARDHGDGHNGMCLASLGAHGKAFERMEKPQTAANHLPDFSLDMGDDAAGTTQPEQSNMSAVGSTQPTDAGQQANSSQTTDSPSSAQGSFEQNSDTSAQTNSGTNSDTGIHGDAGKNTDAPPNSGANSSADNTPGTVNGVQIGIDGHSDWTGSTYQNFTPQQQLDMVKSMGLGMYQTDLNSADPGLTQQIIDAAKNDGVQVMGSIGDPLDSYSNPQDLYNASFAQGAAYGSQFGDSIKYWQLNNEMDVAAMSDPHTMQKAEAEISGLTAGLKSTDPTAKTLINTTSGDTGIQFLKQLQADGINWDVTGYHAYTQSGDVADAGAGGGTTLADDASLGKPIIVNELNGWTSGATDIGPSAIAGNAQLMTNSLDSIMSVAKQDNIIGANFYELLNQPEISGSEGQFGVLNADGGQTATSRAIANYMAANGD